MAQPTLAADELNLTPYLSTIRVLTDNERDWNSGPLSIDNLNGVDIDVGPTRHGITRGHTIYFFDPVGNRNEVVSGGYHVDPDWEVITWTEDQFGKALFYYENRVVDSFVSIHS